MISQVGDLADSILSKIIFLKGSWPGSFPRVLTSSPTVLDLPPLIQRHHESKEILPKPSTEFPKALFPRGIVLLWVPFERRPLVDEVEWNGRGRAELREGRRVGKCGVPPAPCTTELGCSRGWLPSYKPTSFPAAWMSNQAHSFGATFVYSWLRKVSVFQKGERKWEIRRKS